MIKPIKSDAEYKRAKISRGILNDKKVMGRIKAEELDELWILELVIADYEKKFILGVPKKPRPCPFCKSKNLELHLDRGKERGHFVSCKD